MDLDIFKLKLTIDSFVKHAIVRLGGVYHISNSYYEFLVSLNLSFSFPLGLVFYTFLMKSVVFYWVCATPTTIFCEIAALLLPLLLVGIEYGGYQDRSFQLLNQSFHFVLCANMLESVRSACPSSFSSLKALFFW